MLYQPPLLLTSYMLRFFEKHHGRFETGVLRAAVLVSAAAAAAVWTVAWCAGGSVRARERLRVHVARMLGPQRYVRRVERRGAGGRHA